MRDLTKGAFAVSTLVLILAFNNMVSAQTNIQADQRIVEVYGTNHTNNLQASTPERVAYLNYFLDHSYEIKEIPYNAGEKMPKVSSVTMNTKHTGQIPRPAFDVNNFNVLLYNFKRNRTIRTLYRVDNTNKVIYFFAEEQIAKAFNQTK